jgi:hypothetical protein
LVLSGEFWLLGPDPVRTRSSGLERAVKRGSEQNRAVPKWEALLKNFLRGAGPDLPVFKGLSRQYSPVNLLHSGQQRYHPDGADRFYFALDSILGHNMPTLNLLCVQEWKRGT